MNPRIVLPSFFLFFAIAAGLAGCTSKPSESDAKDVAEDFTYVKAKNGLCFGVSNTVSSRGSVNTIAVTVPCASVRL